MYCGLNCLIERYNCIANEWLSIPEPETKVFYSNLVAQDNLLYLVGGDGKGTDGGKKFDGYVQVYDCRLPRWLHLSKSSEMPITNYPTRPKSCIIDRNIYVFNNEGFNA